MKEKKNEEGPITINGKVYIDAQSLVDWLDKLIDPYRGTITQIDDKGNILFKEDYISLNGAHYVKVRKEVLKRMQGEMESNPKGRWSE